MNSAIHTMPIDKIRTAHSKEEHCSQKARLMTTAETTAWIHAFFWVRITYPKPEKAYLNDFMRLIMKLSKVLFLTGDAPQFARKVGQDF